MKDIIDNLKLEKLLVANWANFLDQKKLFAYTLMCVQNHEFGKAVETHKKLLPNIKVTVSLFQLKRHGLVLLSIQALLLHGTTYLYAIEHVHR